MLRKLFHSVAASFVTSPPVMGDWVAEWRIRGRHPHRSSLTQHHSQVPVSPCEGTYELTELLFTFEKWVLRCEPRVICVEIYWSIVRWGEWVLYCISRVVGDGAQLHWSAQPASLLLVQSLHIPVQKVVNIEEEFVQCLILLEHGFSFTLHYTFIGYDWATIWANNKI